MQFDPGIYDRSVDYDSIDALNVSRLLLLDISAKHYRLGVKRATKPMAFGIAAHCATLEPDRFAQDFIVWESVHPEGAVDSKGKPCGGKRRVRSGGAWEAFEAEAQLRGASIVTEADRAQCLALAHAVHDDPAAESILSIGQPEAVLVWTWGDRLCKGRLDWLRDDGFHDLKSCADITERSFQRACSRYRYHVRMAWYREGFRRLYRCEPEVTLIAAESALPHDVVVYDVPDDLLENGLEECRRLLAKLEDCERSGLWPGVGGGARRRLALPKWDLPVEETDTEETYSYKETA
jgi:hypothetical protein